MKKTISYVMISVLLMLCGFGTTALADGVVAHIGEDPFSGVSEAVAAANAGDIVVIDQTDGAIEKVELPFGVSAEIAGETFSDPSYLVSEDIYASVQKANGNAMLYLPSSAAAMDELTAEAFEGIPASATLSMEANTATITWTVGNITLTKSFAVMHASHLSALFISDLKQEDTELPADIDWLSSSKSNVGVGGTAIKIAEDGTVQASAEVKKMKGRGNTSWANVTDGNLETDKKPFNLNLNSKAALVDGAGSYKKWSLIANNYVDYSGISNYLAASLYQEIGGVAAVHLEPVDLYVDGEYRGIYSIFDRVEVGKGRVNVTEAKYTTEDGAAEQQAKVIVSDYESHFSSASGTPAQWKGAIGGASRVEVDQDSVLSSGVLAYSYAAEQTQESLGGGMILEVNLQYTTECGWFITNHGVFVSFKEPERPTREQVEAAAVFVQEFEDALFSDSGYNQLGKHYSEYLDLESFAKPFLLNCFAMQNDFMDASEFLHINPSYEDGKIVEGKLMGGPAWDYNVCSLMSNQLYAIKNGQTGVNGRQVWIEQLLTRGDFVDALYRLQQGSFPDAMETVKEKIVSYGEQAFTSMQMDQNMWNRGSGTVDQYNSRKNAYEYRMNAWPGIWNETALKGVTVSADPETGVLAANVNGDAAYQWYRVDEDNNYQPAIIEGATEATFTPEQNGQYYVKVTGTPLAGTSTSQMISNPVEVQSEEPTEVPSVQGEVEGEKQTSKSLRCPNAFFYEFVTPMIPGEVSTLNASFKIDGKDEVAGDVNNINMSSISNIALRIAAIVKNIPSGQENTPVTTSYALTYSVNGLEKVLTWTRTDSLN